MPILPIKHTHYYYELHSPRVPGVKTEDLILISGYDTHTSFWDPFIPPLTENYRVLRFDLPGSGQTKDQGAPLNLRTIATEVAFLIDKLKLLKPKILGHSMGGSILQWLSIDHGEKIGEIYLVSTVPKWPLKSLKLLEFLLNSRESGLSTELQFEAVLPILLSDETLNNNSLIEQIKQKMRENPFPQKIEDSRRQLSALHSFDTTHHLDKIASPCTVIVGTEDLISPPHVAKSLFKKIKGATYQELPAAHSIPREAPHLLIDLLIPH